MNLTFNEIKKNLQGNNSGGDEAEIQINDLEHKEEINTPPVQNEETRIQKNEERKKKDPGTSPKVPTSKS